ncbi:hypothetical protein Tco_0369766 [Tanacetum coccineum]|uniref:Uncharacterized protein n=1 Tax=Tanacetum coccineum TaxID=301880 RepID=A0ABQ4ZUD2_9ASTR
MTGVGRNTNREFTGCDILSLLEELCPQSLGRSLRCGYRVSEQMRVLLLHLVFRYRTSRSIKSNRLFNEIELFINVDSSNGIASGSSDLSIIKVRDVKGDLFNLNLIPKPETLLATSLISVALWRLRDNLLD